MIDVLFLQVIGGALLLLYAVRITGQGFELAFGERLEAWWSAPGRTPLSGFGVGIVGTALLQSSGAVVTLLITFAEIAPLSLARSLSIAMGGRIVANAHTLFNLTLSAFFLPLVPRVARILDSVVPGRKAHAPRGKPVYLDREHLPVTGVALGQVAREIVRMADMIQEMQKAAGIVIARKKSVGQRERDLRMAHIHRLRKGTPESLESSAPTWTFSPP